MRRHPLRIVPRKPATEDQAIEELRALKPIDVKVLRLAKKWAWTRWQTNKLVEECRKKGLIDAYKPEIPAKPLLDPLVSSPVSKEPEALLETGAPRFSCEIVVRWTCRIVLGALAFGIAWCGLQINMWYGSTLGRTQEASSMFGYGSVAADLLALFLPTAAGVLWTARQRIKALIAWGLFAVTIVVAINATIGFAALNIADTTAARAKVTADRSMLTQKMGRLVRDEADARAAIARGDHPASGARRRDDLEKQLAAVEGQISALPAITVSDPQADAASALLKWVSIGAINLSPESVRFVRILGMTALFNLAGLVLMLAWGCGARSRQ